MPILFPSYMHKSLLKYTVPHNENRHYWAKDYKT